MSVSAFQEALVIGIDGVDDAQAVQRDVVMRCLEDPRRLELLVGAVLGDVRGRVLDVAVQELGPGAAGNPTTGGLFRVSGTTTTGDGDRAWSLVLKVLRLPRGTRGPWDEPTDVIYWRRELNLVETGLLGSIAGLAAPRCYAVSYISPDMCWLWLEDLGSLDRARWSASEYRMLARALAQFHAPYLTGTPIPDYPWLNRSFLRDFHAHCKPLFDRLFEAVESASGGLLAELGPASPGSGVAPLMRILADPEPWLTVADGLPQTLSHQDANIDNLTWRSSPDDELEVVAIDWQMLGPASIGSDLGQLLCDVPGSIASEPRAAVVESVLREYHRELSRLGARVGWEEVQLAFAVDTVLRQGMWKLYLLCEELEAPDKKEMQARDASVTTFLREVREGHLLALAEQLLVTQRR